MRQLIRERAESLNIELTSHDYDQIIERYWFLMVKDGEVSVKGIDHAIKAYLE